MNTQKGEYEFKEIIFGHTTLPFIFRDVCIIFEVEFAEFLFPIMTYCINAANSIRQRIIEFAISLDATDCNNSLISKTSEIN